MATILDVLVVPTYNKKYMEVKDNSVYDVVPVSPTLNITIPSTGETVSVEFIPASSAVVDSSVLGLSETGEDLIALPDGVYQLQYTIDPAETNYVNKTIMRIDQLQESFDAAFMKLDMMECDRAIKKQSKEDLSTIYFFIQASLAAANNCAVDEANKLYRKAAQLLTYFMRNNCGCGDNNYITNFV